MNAITEISSNEFATQVREHPGPVLVDFFAQWCGPCKMLNPVLEQIATEQQQLKIVKVDADTSSELMSQYGIRGIPTLMLFQQGEVVDTKVGAASLSQIREFVAQV